MTTKRNKLKQFAEAVNRKDWQRGIAGDANVVTYYDSNILGVCIAFDEPVADFIAAANPAAVLELINAAEQLESDAQELLERRKNDLHGVMGAISEYCEFASWSDGNEFRLWRAVVDPDDDLEYGMFSPIEEEDVGLLRRLSTQVNGWFVADGEYGKRSFVPLERWLEMYAAAPDRRTPSLLRTNKQESDL